MVRGTIVLVVLAAFALAGCDRWNAHNQRGAAAPPPPAEAKGYDRGDMPGDHQGGPAQPNQAPAPGLPPADPTAYVGRWAATPALCDKGAWRFYTDGVSTAGETGCAFNQVTERAGGFDVVASCKQGGVAKAANLRLTPTESGHSMLVEGAPFATTGLVRCGTDAAAD